jgi:RimJ/RimL family protein N-acetyltransferase
VYLKRPPKLIPRPGGHSRPAELVPGAAIDSPDVWKSLEPIPWTLARRWWSHGFATEGARAALTHAFTVLEKDRVISLIHPENRRSIRVAERIGERLQGRIEHLGRELLCYGIDRKAI